MSNRMPIPMTQQWKWFGKQLPMTHLLYHMLDSYFWMRIMLIIVGVLLPLVLWLGGLRLGIELQDSMSAYYHVKEAELLRDFFVGGIFAIGVLLLAYKAYGVGENWILDGAGIAAFLAATFPECKACGPVTLHGIAAGTFFVCIALVIFFCKSNTLEQSGLSQDEIAHFNGWYYVAGVLMLAGPGLSLMGHWTGFLKQWLFFAEATGAWAFALYWGVKTWELSKSNLELNLVDQKPPTATAEI